MTFGQIATEPCSRAAWEDGDNITGPTDVELKWQWQLVIPDNKIHTFVVLEGKYLADCIKYQTKKMEVLSAVPEVHLTLYRNAEEKKYICTILDYDLVLSSQIVELLRPVLNNSEQVVAIQTKPLAEYLCSGPTAPTSCIRAVYTTKSTPVVFFPRLEQPNIISGVSAGILALREHFCDMATALVAYLETYEEYNSAEVEQMLTNLKIVNAALRPKLSCVLTSNLYI